MPSASQEICDVTDEAQRNEMVEKLQRLYPQLDMLVNNAGAKQPTDLLGNGNLNPAMARDIVLNFEAPVGLCTQLLPHLRERSAAAIVNVTTGLVHLAKAEQAFYCAAKAALHSYTQSLRWALRGTTVAVYEVYLPLVDTNFHQGGLSEGASAITPERAAQLALDGIRRGRGDVYVGKASLARWISVLAPNAGLKLVNR